MSNDFDAIPVGKTTVSLSLDEWEKHGRVNQTVLILCKEDPCSDYDSIRFKPTIAETREAVEWIIKNEGREQMKGYTPDQIKHLQKQICKIMA